MSIFSNDERKRIQKNIIEWSAVYIIGKLIDETIKSLKHEDILLHGKEIKEQLFYDYGGF